MKTVQWEPSCYMLPEKRQLGRHEGRKEGRQAHLKKLTVAFCIFVKGPKNGTHSTATRAYSMFYQSPSVILPFSMQR